MLDPKFPVVSGKVQLNNEWSVHLPSEFNKRTEEGSMVLWKPQFTIWLFFYDNDGVSIKDSLEGWQNFVTDDIFDIVKEQEDRFSFSIQKDIFDKSAPALNGFIFGKSGYIKLAMYLDEEKSLLEAKEIFSNFKENLV
jgi:hypothetical protein